MSSSAGHQLMTNHPYRDARLKQANNNTQRLIKALQDDNFNEFSEICEEEALSLHALMMSSRPGYTLLEPSTLVAIERIKAFRQETGLPITFTLDAGPNLHVLYPAAQAKTILPFLKIYLRPICEDNQLLTDEISFSSK